MKKIIVAALVSILSFSVFAKGSSHVNDSSTGVVGSCLVRVDDANSMRYINVAYIRAVEILKSDTYETANPSVVSIRMASNYSARSVYSVNYGSPEKAIAALEDIAKKINTCGKD